MALNVKDGLAMRLTHLGNRLALAAALMGAIAPATGCRSTPFIDQTAEVPREPGQPGTDLAKEDAEVQTAQFLENLPLPLPRVAEPRTTSNPEAAQDWRLTLQEAIRIGLENSEVVRVIDLGAQGIPVGGFEPRQFAPVNIGGGGASNLAGGALGAGGLQTVYDPAVQEAAIARALSAFDATLSAQINLARQVSPVNNSFTAGIFAQGDRFPFISINEGFSPFGSTPTAGATLSKQIATGGQVAVSHNIFNNYTNSPNNVFPSFWAAQTQLRFGQPLLGFSPTFGPSGVEANRADIVVSRLNADFSVWSFKQEVMRHVRSIEQQYWSLAQEHVKLWAAQAAAELSQKLLDDVLARQEVGSMEGGREDVAEAREQYEAAQLSLVTATSNVLTTERQLRNILGLPPSDNRRIIPVTEPTDARLEPNWEASLAQMVSFHPDIVQSQLNVRIAEMQLLVARNQLLPALDFNVLYQFNGFGQDLDTAEAVGTGAMLKAFDPLQVSRQTASGLNPLPGNYSNFQTWQVGFTFQMPLGFRSALSNTRVAQLSLLRQRALLQQTVHQSTHQLARFFLEVDANYKQYRAASRVTSIRHERLETLQARYEEGMRDRSTNIKAVDIRAYVSAINSWTAAVAQEAEFKSTYNTSIAVLEETKGTLLAYDNIAVAEGPWPRKAYIQAHDQQAAHRQFPIGGDGPYHPRPFTGNPVPDPLPPNPPPDLGAPGTRPNLPAPAGPLAPAPLSFPPNVPAADTYNILMDNRSSDASVRQAADPAPIPAPAELPPLPSGEPKSSEAEEPSLPPIALPPLPAE
jgi:outer membrane protein TolC